MSRRAEKIEVRLPEPILQEYKMIAKMAGVSVESVMKIALAQEARRQQTSDALEAMRLGLRYAVRVWVLSDEIEWSDAEIDEAVERVIGYAQKEARDD